ncbi:MAG: cellulase family glycosylhydrolase [Bacteroidales bacterium]|nr:cellulase family glycosylhydrolase [Bacteroidales bacterium]MBO5979697.1 cellulase family glycosylhydrolase [Bacteroidales bacterium]
MKKFMTSLMCLMSVLAVSCSPGMTSVSEEYKISPRSLDFPGEGGTLYVTIQTKTEVVAVSDVSWCEVTQEQTQSTRVRKFAVKAPANDSVNDRTGAVEFTIAGKYTETVTISQKGYEAPPVKPEIPEVLPPDKTGMESDAKTLMKKMHLGINLGNTLEAIGGETAWGAPRTTEEIILYFKELGFNAVRIPCSWDQNLESGEGYIVKDSWMSRVKEVVDYVVKNDMYAVLNIHWDGGWLENDIPNGYNAEVDAQQKSIWTQIAKVFRDYDEHLVFAGTNEPNVENASQMPTLLRYEQTFIDAVRATGGRNAYRVLVFQGPSTDVDKTEQMMNTLPKDNVENRLAAEVHYYTPWQFCGLSQDESWGKMMYFWGDDQKGYATGAYAGRWLSGNNEALVAKQMAKMKKKFWDNGIPVIIGEYSVCSSKNCNLGTDEENKRAEEGYMKSRAAFNGCVVKEAKSNGCVPFYWHCQGDLIDRRTLSVTEEATYEAIIEAGKTQYPL